MVFAAEPLDLVASMLGGGETTQRTLFVGYGSYRYTYESWRTGDAPLAAFAIRGRELVVYLVAEGNRHKTLLAKLGKHKMGKSCLYFKQLADLDKTVLDQLVAGSVAEVRRRYR